MGDDASAWFTLSQSPGESSAERLGLTGPTTGNVTVSPGTIETNTLIDNTSGNTQLVLWTSAALVGGTYSQDCHIKFSVKPGGGLPVAPEFPANPPFGPMLLDPPLPVEDGEDFDVSLTNDSGATVEFEASCVFYEI